MGDSGEEFERLVARARQRFLETGGTPAEQLAAGGHSGVRDAILASWRRSQSLGVDVDQLDPPYRPDVDSDSKLMHAARPVLDQLEVTLADAAMCVLLTDERGRVLARRAGTDSLVRHLDRIKLATGFSYAEEHVGTNGIGTAIETRRPYHVFGSEHFSERLQTMSCAGAPIRNPLTGRLAGLLDVTCWQTGTTTLMPALVQSAAAEIEQRLVELGSERERAMLTEFLAASRHPSRAILTISDNLTMTNARAGELLDQRDHVIVREKSAELLAAGREHGGEVTLSDGRLAIVRCRPVSCSSGTAGAVVEVALAAPELPAPPSRRVSLSGLGLAGTSPAYRAACQEIEQQCRSRSWVLIAGEAGVGKLEIVQALHRRWYPARAFTVVDARNWRPGADRPPDPAGAGTVVLRHADEIPDGAADIVGAWLDGLGAHWVVGTVARSDGAALELRGHFGVTVDVPPLRHRIDDVRDLVPMLLRRLAPGRSVSCGSAALRTLLRAPWVGNVAELANALAVALTRRGTGEITPADLPESCHSTSRHVLTPWEALERDAIVRTLLDTSGDKQQAAAMLGISRATIYRKINTYGIVVDSHDS